MTDTTPPRKAAPRLGTWVNWRQLHWALRYRVHGQDHLAEVLERFGVLDGRQQPTPVLLARKWAKRGDDGEWLFRRPDLVAWVKAQHVGLPADYVGRALAKAAVEAFTGNGSPASRLREEEFDRLLERDFPEDIRSLRVGWLILDAFFENIPLFLHSQFQSWALASTRSPEAHDAMVVQVEAAAAARGLRRELAQQCKLMWDVLPDAQPAAPRPRL